METRPDVRMTASSWVKTAEMYKNTKHNTREL
jgi:hypothetical protein